MSNDFNLDNAGTGFSMDDDVDIDVMLSQASQGEDERENGSEHDTPGNPGGSAISLDDLRDSGDAREPDHHISTPTMERQPTPVAHPEPTPTPEPEPEPERWVEEPQQERFGSTMLPPEEEEETEARHVPEPEPEPEPEPKPVAPPQPEPTFIEPEPERSPEPGPSFREETQRREEATAPTRNRIRVPSGAEELQRIRLIVGILDACRALNATDRDIVGKFLAQDEEAELSEDELVFQVLTSHPSVRTGIRQIKEAKALIAVERAFYVIELGDTDLYNMGNLISIFSEEEPDRNSTRTQYARQLVKCVDQLDAVRMQYVEAIQSVLAVLEETE